MLIWYTILNKKPVLSCGTLAPPFRSWPSILGAIPEAEGQGAVMLALAGVVVMVAVVVEAFVILLAVGIAVAVPAAEVVLEVVVD